MQLAFRPHHFLCTLCFKGKGYSRAFIHNFTEIVKRLHAEKGETEIKVVAETDSICAPCPHRQGARCATEDAITVLDTAHADALKIKSGDVMTWNAAKDRIAENINLDVFHKICVTCSWKKTGMCEGVVRDFLKIS